MRKIAHLVDRELRWVAPDWRGGKYELRDGDTIEATLRFRSAWGTLATGESADGCWSFKRVGFLQTRVTIRACDSEQELAVFRNNSWSGGGTLELPDGRRYQADTNFWMTAFTFSDPDGIPIVRYRRIGGLLHLSSDIGITHAGAAVPELPWLVMLGWYLTVQLHNDAAAAGSASG